MANLLRDIALWITLGGFAVFCVLYATTRPWQDHMGRHVLAFMTGFAIAFAYATVSRYIPEPDRTHGWVVVLTMIAFLVWWRVAILIKYQILARRHPTE